MLSRRSLAQCAVMCAMLATSPSAFAQAADDLNTQALATFERGEYEQAAALFAQAYAIDPDPTFRKSEAVAWFKADRCEDAIIAANAFLHATRGTASAGDRVEPQAVVANCKTSMAETAIGTNSFSLAERLLFEAEQIAPDDYTRDRITATRVTLANARARRDGKSANPNEVTPIEPPPKVDAARSSAPGWVAVGVGASALVAGAVWHTVTLTNTVPALREEANGGDPDQHRRLSRQVSTARTMVWVLYGLGGASMGFGGWYLMTKDGAQTAGTEVGLSWSGRF